MNTKLFYGIVLLFVSAMVLSTPTVSEAMDIWRGGFSLASFIFGWMLIIDGFVDKL